MVLEVRTLDLERMMAYARASWNSEAYQETILPIRQNPTLASDYTVTIYAEAPLREDMLEIGAAPFDIEDFSDQGVEQTEETAQ